MDRPHWWQEFTDTPVVGSRHKEMAKKEDTRAKLWWYNYRRLTSTYSMLCDVFSCHDLSRMCSDSDTYTVHWIRYTPEWLGRLGDEGSRRLPKRLSYCFSVLASATNLQIYSSKLNCTNIDVYTVMYTTCVYGTVILLRMVHMYFLVCIQRWCNWK